LRHERVKRSAARLLAVFATLLPVVALAADAASELLVTVGEVTPESAIIWLRSEAGQASVAVRGPDGTTVRRLTAVTSAADDHTARLGVTGLRPRTRYRYEMAAGTTTAAGEFVTAPAADEPAAVSFAWSGDLGSSDFCRRVDAGYPIFRALRSVRPDFFLFVGDTIYADGRCRGEGVVPGSGFVATTLDGYRDKHRYNRADPAVQAFFRATSVYAIWDDHDVRNDFGPAEPRMPAGRRAFLEYWPVAAPPGEPARLYRKFRWGKLLEVFILDTRQYRSPNTERDGPAKTMLGRTQRRWLLDEVAASQALWKVVVSSVPMSVPTGRPERRDAWSNASVWGVPQEDGTGFAVERDAILRSLRERGVENLVVLAADVHHAELIRHHPAPDFSFHEFIAGPLSATRGRPRPLDAGLNPRSLFARGGVTNFGVVTVEPSHLTVAVVGENGSLLFSHTIGPE
jgi:alkaline phosphatase D